MRCSSNCFDDGTVIQDDEVRRGFNRIRRQAARGGGGDGFNLLRGRGAIKVVHRETKTRRYQYVGAALHQIPVNRNAGAIGLPVNPDADLPAINGEQYGVVVVECCNGSDGAFQVNISDACNVGHVGVDRSAPHDVAYRRRFGRQSTPHVGGTCPRSDDGCTRDNNVEKGSLVFSLALQVQCTVRLY